MKSKKFFTFSFAAISLFGLGASIFSSRTSDYVAVKATSGENDQSKIVVGEEELNEAENPLTVAIVDTTTTAYGASFDLKFSTGGHYNSRFSLVGLTYSFSFKTKFYSCVASHWT